MRHKDGLLPNSLAFGYAILGWMLGLYLCVSASLLSNVMGVVLLAHAMIIAAYLIHECAHNTVFAKPAINAKAAEVLLWITGASYSSFADIRAKHMRHHVDRADVVAMDYRDWLARQPALLTVVRGLEAIGVPAVEIGLRWIAIVLPFVNREFAYLRMRVATVLALRILALAALATISPRILLLYPLAYMLCLQMLRYMDAHQHTYDLRADLYDPDAKKGPAAGLDRDFEERNTFSNPLSERWPVLNLLILNFCYHNAHHRKPTEPWYRLRRIHNEAYGEEHAQTLIPADIRQLYRAHAVERILHEDNPDIGVRRDNARDFIGVDGVSFLVPY